MLMPKINAKINGDNQRQNQRQTMVIDMPVEQLPAKQIQLVSAWLEKLLQQNYSHHTLGAYRRAVMNLLVFLHI